MKTRIRKIWDGLRSNYWFIPLIMMALAILLWIGTSTIDRIISAKDKGSISWLYVDTIDSMRTLLLTIEGIIIGIVGVVFSIMMVPLTIAASQFGPRLLRTFLRDMGTQITLGTFTSTFIFCLLILLQLRGGPERHLPQISATIGLLLGITSFGVLIFFINHVATSLQVSVLVAHVSKELNKAIDHNLSDAQDNLHFPLQTDASNAVSFDFTKPNRIINATASGYVQARDDKGLLHLAHKHELVLQLLSQPGDFVIENTPLAIIWPDVIQGNTDERINKAFILGPQRTLIQDITFGINELVEVAIRALSPAINDPFTAMTCLDRLGSALSRTCTCTFPKSKVLDMEGHLRLIRKPVTFSSLTDAAFTQIREYGRTSMAVTLRLMDTIAVVLQCVSNEEQINALLHHATLVEHGCHIGLPEKTDRQVIMDSYKKIINMAGKSAYKKNS